MRTTWKAIAVSLLAMLGMFAATTPAHAASSNEMERIVTGAWGYVQITEYGTFELFIHDTAADGHRAVAVMYVRTDLRECHNTKGANTAAFCVYPVPQSGTQVSLRVDVREGTKIIRSSTFIVGTYRNGMFEDIYVP